MEIKKDITMEEAFDQLNVILDDMEQSDHTLEEEFQLYEAAMKLVQYCKEEIDAIEKKLIILEEDEEDDNDNRRDS